MSITYEIRCADQDCDGFGKNLEDGYLVKIGGVMHCAYCRGYKFLLAITKIDGKPYNPKEDK